MKKGLKTIIIIAAGALAAAAAFGAAYRLSSGFRGWAANSAGESEGAASTPPDETYTVSRDLILKITLPHGGVFKSSDAGGLYHSPVGSYLAAAFTISEPTLADRKIVADWADQYDPDIRIVDAQDNPLDAAATRQTVESGSTLYFRLAAVFAGDRYLIAHPEASAGSVASISLSCDAASIAAATSSAN
jgi:hypothetical protein